MKSGATCFSETHGLPYISPARADNYAAVSLARNSSLLLEEATFVLRGDRSAIGVHEIGNVEVAYLDDKTRYSHIRIPHWQ